MQNGMESDKISYQLIEGIPEKGILIKLKPIYSIIFEDADLDFFEKRLYEKDNILIVIATYNNDFIGFKIGYRYNDITFYSWVGGVKKEFRKLGIGKELARIQEGWAKQNDYLKLRTKSMNRFKPMMILNLRNGFDIVSVYTNEKEQTKIVFEKQLN